MGNMNIFIPLALGNSSHALRPLLVCFFFSESLEFVFDCLKLLTNGKLALSLHQENCAQNFWSSKQATQVRLHLIVVYLTVNFFFSLNLIYLLFEILLQKNFGFG